MNEFFRKMDYEYLLEQMGEIALETKVGRELTRKKNGTYFLEKSTDGWKESNTNWNRD